MRLVVLQHEAKVADFVFGTEAVYVGTHTDNRVQLADPRIAERQLVLYPERDGWAIEQLATECEVHINATALRDKARLSTGDEIRLCDYTIRVYPEHVEQVAAHAGLGTSKAQLERFAASRLPTGTIIKKINDPITVQPDQIVRLGELNVMLGQCTLIPELMDAALQALLQTFAAPRAWIGVRRYTYGSLDYVEGRLLSGQTTDLPDFAEILKPRVLDRIQYLLVPVFSRQERVSALAGPLRAADGAIGMIYIDTGETGRRFNAEDMEFFTLFSNVVAAQLAAILKHVAAGRVALVEGQVAVSHEIQARVTPRKLPQWPELQFGAFRETGLEKTGDVYDVVKLRNGIAAFMVAHTTATGAMPSMLMAQAQAAFRIAGMHQHGPSVFLRSLNWLLYDGEKDHPLDCFVAQIDPASGQMQYGLAGQAGAFIINNRGEARRLGPDEPAPQLGLSQSSVYAVLPEQLEPGETLAVYTPGVVTARNRAGDAFGEERFVEILCDGFGQLASTMLKEMLSDLKAFTEGGVQPEDITVLLAHYTG
jgi:serine phosphatase RsbU (regulator of sigma subunit)